MTCLQLIEKQFVENDKKYKISLLHELLHPLRGMGDGGLRLLQMTSPCLSGGEVIDVFAVAQ